MHPDWQQFLEDQGATFDDAGRAVFADAPAAPDCALCDLSQLGLIRASGTDRVTFLQGQLTNDVSRIGADHSHLSAFCSPKGRMLALFRVFERDDALLLQLPGELLPAALKRMGMYVLRSQVTLEDASADLTRIGIAGECAADLLPGDPPAADDGVVRIDDLTVIRLPGDRPRFEVIGPNDSVIALWRRASASATPAGVDFWPLLDIRAGLPNVYQATVEAFVPQMTNLQLIDGVSFAKGCYTGQEVVARMQYLGKLKRRMYRFSSADSLPAPGEAIYRQHSNDSQSVGRVVDARPGPDGAAEGLAVMQIDSAGADDLRLAGPEGAPLTLGNPPYGFDSGDP